MKKYAFLLIILIVSSCGFHEQEKLLKKMVFNGKTIKIFADKITITDRKGIITDVYFAGKERIKDGCISASDGTLFIITGLNGEPRGDRIIVLSQADGKLERVFTFEDSGQNPWKIETAKLDRNMTLFICIGVWKKTRLDPVFDNRLFVYAWDGKKFIPKWRGSRLSSPFIDFTLADINKDGIYELISLELQKNRLYRIMSYKWNGFGFDALKVMGNDLKIRKLSQMKFQ